MSEIQNWSFQTGVQIKLIENKVQLKEKQSSSFIGFDSLDNFSYTSTYIPRLNKGTFLFRGIAVHFILIFIAAVYGDSNISSNFFSGIVAIGVILISLVIFVLLHMLDTFLGFGLVDSVINTFFSDKGFFVVIGNISGNNLEFLATTDELSKIKALQLAIDNIKAKPRKAPEIKVVGQSSNLDDLKKLGELRDLNLITEEEFTKKKKVILGL